MALRIPAVPLPLLLLGGKMAMLRLGKPVTEVLTGALKALSWLMPIGMVSAKINQKNADTAGLPVFSVKPGKATGALTCKVSVTILVKTAELAVADVGEANGGG